MNIKFTLLFFVVFLISVVGFAQPTAFTTCPNGNVATARISGSTTGPISIYDVNTATGTATLLSGPILDPMNASVNLQVNGLGLNIVDGFLYGLFSAAPATLSTVPTTPYYRLGANAQAVQLGTLMGPPFVTGDNGSFVIPNAGEFNQSGTYYFPAITGFVGINPFNLPASTFTPSTFYIGALTGSNTMPAGTGALSPTYVTLTNPSNDATAYLAASSVTITATNAQGLGLQDLVYNNADGNLYTYVSYPNGSSGYFGQMLRINPTTGILSAVAPPALESFLTANTFPNGMFLDATGNFLILLTNGSIYRAVGTPTTWTGALTLVNATSSLPNPLTGDMASCGMITIALPNDPFEFNINRKANQVHVHLLSYDETNVNYYEVEYSSDGSSFETVGTIQADGQKSYDFVHPNYFTNPFNYYRIKLIGFDGNATYSAIRSIQATADNIQVFPNPLSNELNIKFPEKWIGRNAVVTLVNQVGQTVLQKKIAKVGFEEHMHLEENLIPNGIYFLRMSTNGQSFITKKVHVIR